MIFDKQLNVIREYHNLDYLTYYIQAKCDMKTCMQQAQLEIQKKNYDKAREWLLESKDINTSVRAAIKSIPGNIETAAIGTIIESLIIYSGMVFYFAIPSGHKFALGDDKISAIENKKNTISGTIPKVLFAPVYETYKVLRQIISELNDPNTKTIEAINPFRSQILVYLDELEDILDYYISYVDKLIKARSDIK